MSLRKPTYAKMISDALVNSNDGRLILNPELGKRQVYVSRAAIKKWIIYNMAAHISVQTIDRSLRKAIKLGVSNGKFIQYKQSFCLPKDN
jgi:hypothetical protein